ncbi:MAG TPA: putative lipid II flippase FtsW [Egibacteraceae bacterium]|nr:putative lipid II flippase FtsW [Egibacteraceae bacterium]
MLAVAVGALLALGLVMTFSSSFVQSTAETGDPFGIFRRQLLWCLFGLPPMVLAAATDYRAWRRATPLLLLGSLALAAAVLIPSVGIVVNGARRWIALGWVRFQPAELVKLSLPLYLAHVLARRWPRLRRGDLAALLLPAVPLTAIAAGLVLAEPDLETALLLVAVAGVLLVVGGLPVRMIAAGVGLATVVGLASIATTPYRRGRVAAWLDPAAYPDTFGYQVMQAYLALGSGGWLGVGLGQSRGKWLFIPNAHTDFVFAIIGEELGLVGALGVVLLFAAVAVGGLRAARRAPDPFGRLLAAAITGWLLVQAAVNIGSVVGLLPVTGVTLPLVSFGGTSLVSTMLGCGLLMSVARHARRAPARAPVRRQR